MKNIGIGIIGSGFISRSFALSFASAPKTMNLLGDHGITVNLAAASSHSKERAQDFASRFGVARAYDDWRQLVADDNVDAVLVGSEDHLHFAQAALAIEHGKHVLCEKPIGMSTEECEKLYKMAQDKGVVHAVGFTYLANPAMFLMKELIDSGELGEIYSFSGHYNEDYFSDPQTPYNWRCDEKRAYSGAGADLGYHLAGALIYLFGSPAKVAALRQVKVKERKDADGASKPVTTDDITNGIIKYDNGISGTFQSSRVATGRKLYQRLEIHGTKGAILLDMEDFNQLYVHLPHKNKAIEGYTRVMVGPEHKYYNYFCPAPGHGMSFNDFITIQASQFLRAIGGSGAPIADLSFGLSVQKLIAAMARSSEAGEWASVS